MNLSCNGCGIETAASYHIDHIVPKARGGSNSDPANFQVLCRTCNLSKSTLTMREWVVVPNARCRAHWWWRVDQAPAGVRETRVPFPIRGRLKDIRPDLPSVSGGSVAITLSYGFTKGDRVWIDDSTIIEETSGICVWISEFGVKLRLFNQKCVLFIPTLSPLKLSNRSKEGNRFRNKSESRRSRRRFSNLRRTLS